MRHHGEVALIRQHSHRGELPQPCHKIPGAEFGHDSGPHRMCVNLLFASYGMWLRSSEEEPDPIRSLIIREGGASIAKPHAVPVAASRRPVLIVVAADLRHMSAPDTSGLVQSGDLHRGTADIAIATAASFTRLNQTCFSSLPVLTPVQAHRSFSVSLAFVNARAVVERGR